MSNDYFVIEPCTSSNAFEVKLKGKKFNLDRAANAILEAGGRVGAITPVFILVSFEGNSASIYSSGRMMIKCNERLKPKETEAIANRLMALLEKGNVF